MKTEQIQKKLVEIQKLPEEKRSAPLRQIAKEIGAYYIPADGTADTYTLYHNIHTHLQSEMMLNACVSAEGSSSLTEQACSSAKWSCRWAAIAAMISLVGSVATWIMVFVEFNTQT